MKNLLRCCKLTVSGHIKSAKVVSTLYSIACNGFLMAAEKLKPYLLYSQEFKIASAVIHLLVRQSISMYFWIKKTDIFQQRSAM